MKENKSSENQKLNQKSEKNSKKNQKNTSKTSKNTKNNAKSDEPQNNGKKHKSVVWLFGVGFLSVGLLLFCQFFYGDTVSDKTTFYPGTTINGIDVSGLNKEEASNVVSAKMLENLDDVNLTLKYGEKKWRFDGKDFEVNPDISPKLQEVLAVGREGNIFEKTSSARKIKKEGLNVTIPYSEILTGLDQKIEDISFEIETLPQSSQLVFNPNQDVAFSKTEEVSGVQIDRDALENLIKQGFEKSNSVQVEIPVTPILPDRDQKLMLEDIAVRSTFSTDYSSSSAARKNNVALALSKFNGMIVQPGEEVSFNQTTGQRSEENGYKSANIIKNGVFVQGSGGGVCQASTTLYNALLLAGLEIKEVHHHSLPVSYVPLSTDAMVSEGYADLVFENNTDAPIYIKTEADNSKVSVTIYGVKLQKEIKIRSQLVSIIPHTGDKIVQDYSGQYDKFVLYQGEYYRIKYPKEGYESRAFLQYFVDGKLEKEEEIRHDFYYPQEGVVVEGSERLAAGMNLPKSDVTLIPAQKLTEQHFDNIKEKFKTTYPNAYGE